jgi:hypothetical protein
MKFDVDQCIELLKERKLPDLDSIRELCKRVKDILAGERNVLEVPAPVTIVGDIHGQVCLIHLPDFFFELKTRLTRATAKTVL